MQIFRPPPLQTSKKIQGPFLALFAMKNYGSTQPQRKSEKKKKKFTKKCVVIFFKTPLQIYYFFSLSFTRVNNFKGPLFASRAPNKCLWTVPKLHKHSQSYMNIPESCIKLHFVQSCVNIASCAKILQSCAKQKLHKLIKKSHNVFFSYQAASIRPYI